MYKFVYLCVINLRLQTIMDNFYKKSIFIYFVFLNIFQITLQFRVIKCVVIKSSLFINLGLEHSLLRDLLDAEENSRVR